MRFGGVCVVVGLFPKRGAEGDPPGAVSGGAHSAGGETHGGIVGLAAPAQETDGQQYRPAGSGAARSLA